MSDPLRAPDPDDRLTDGVPAGPVKGRTRSRVLLLVGVILVMGLGAGGAYVLAGDDEATASEVILEPATSDGEDPFFDSIASSTIDVRGGGLELASSVRSIGGDTPGLYGGTGEDVCDPAALVGFLEGNADKAAAFAKVLGITTGGIADYVAKLTPVVLREDTRVTNHGFSGGKATPRQSVLQAGTAVMVDDRGVPRVRCSCGNPLSEPAPVDGAAKLRGDAWAGFDEDRVLTVTPAGEALTELELVDLNTGQAYLVAVGTSTPVTTTTTVAPVALTLDGDGVGDLVFGASAGSVAARLDPAFGTPTIETYTGEPADGFDGYYALLGDPSDRANGLGFPEPAFERHCYANGLCVVLGGPSHSDLALRGWTYSRPTDDNGEPLEVDLMQTADGVTIGTTAADRPDAVRITHYFCYSSEGFANAAGTIDATFDDYGDELDVPPDLPPGTPVGVASMSAGTLPVYGDGCA